MSSSKVTASADRPAAAYRYSERLPSDSVVLTEILKTAEFSQLFESYYNLIHIPVAIIDLKANVLFSSRWQRICMEFHRVHPETCKRCIESDTKIAQQLTEGRTYAIYRCLNGLTDCASPIVLEGRHVANVFVGQFFTQEPDLPWFRRQAVQFGFDPTAYLDAVRDVPVVAEERIPVVLDLLVRMTRVVTGLSVERQHAIDEEAREKVILDTIPQSVFWKDLEGKYLGCNAAFAKVAGLGSPVEIVGKTDFDLPWSKAEAETYRADDKAVIASRQARVHFIESIHQSDGSRIVADTSKIPLVQAGGIIRGLVGIFDDITARRQAEEELRLSEERYRRIVETAQEGIFMFDAGWKLAFANRRFAELLGYAQEELIGRPITDIILESDRDAHSSRKASQEAGTARIYENAYRKQNGEPIWFRVSVSPIVKDGVFLGSFGMATDITSERQARIRQRESDERLRVAFKTGPDAIVIIERDTGRICEANDRMLELYGFAREELIGQTSVGLGMWADPEVRQKLLVELRAKGVVESFEVRARRKNGELFWVSYSVSELNTPGTPLYMGVIHDITQRKKVAEELREAEKLYRDIFERAGEGIFRASPQGPILTANPTLARILGYDSPQQAIKDIPDVALLWSSSGDFERTFNLLKERGELRNHECALRRRDGAQIWISMNARSVAGPDGTALYYEGFVSDITEKKKLEEQFLRVQRLESIGMLAAGIAHDLNNVLAPIGMVVSLLRPSLKEPSDLRLLQTLDTSAVRGAGLVRQILGFARGVSGEPQLVQVKHLMRDVIEMVLETFPKSIVLEEHLPQGLWPVMANPTQLHQVVLNLCVNARDAMPNGGKLRLAAGNRHLDTAQAAEFVGGRAGAWIKVEVEDTGTGMTPDVLARMWDPFFTTKEPGKGTGLGLSTVRGIVETHGGFITVSSQPDRGTTFQIYLPAAESGTTATEGRAAARIAQGRGETILFADDEASIREIVARVLSVSGYWVELAEDGAKAAEIFRSRPDSFHLVVTDLDMPVMDGATFARQVREIRPATKIIALSGTDKSVAELNWAEYADEFVQKPFVAEELIAAVQRLLKTEGI